MDGHFLNHVHISMFNVFPPHPREGGLDLFLEALDQFAVGGDKGLLRGEGWDWNRKILQNTGLNSLTRRYARCRSRTSAVNEDTSMSHARCVSV